MTMCDCITTTNERLKDFGLKLDVGICFGDNVSAFIPIHTQLIDDEPVGRGHKKKNATPIISPYCPLCGEKRAHPEGKEDA